MKTLLKLSAAALILVAASASAGTITGSAHDFQSETWTTEICQACHAPHNNGAEAARTGELLWNHEESAVAAYTVYSSPTFSQTMDAALSGASKLCMSCHDGTVAVDSFGGAAGGTFLTGADSFGTDLSNDHPISFPYTVESELAATTTPVTFGDASTGTLADMLDGGNVECSSCHDVHNTKAAPSTKLLLVDNAGSALCLTCHVK